MSPRNLLFAALVLASASGCSEGSGGEPPVKYTFDRGTEGWALNTDEGSTFTNLGAGVPDGGAPVTLSFAESDGDPRPGALRLTAPFTAPGQYVATGVVFDRARDLTGKTLHAQIRLVSGAATGVWAGFYACRSGCIGLAMSTNTAELAGDAWAPLASPVQAFPITVGPPDSGDFTSVDGLGIEIWTDGGTDDAGAFASSGDLVFEIDTVTE